MPYKIKKFDSLFGVSGFSSKMLRNHFDLYEGYVANINKLSDKLVAYVKKGKMHDIEYAELKRRFGWEFNGMRLHEYYFGNMVKKGREIDKSSNLCDKIREDFGSYEKWEKDFKNTGMIRGIGWAVLYCDCNSDKLFNIWVDEHDSGHISCAQPVLVMDVFEHAYATDYELKRASYIDSFLKSVDWRIVEERFDNA